MDLSENCYWHSSIATMKTCSQNTIIEQLKLQDEKLFDGKKTSASQITAWEDELEQIYSLIFGLPYNWEIILEYILPREYRRPDVILLTGKEVIVLEFKQYNEVHFSHIDQVRGYVRDLKEYQSYCANHEVIPFVILTGENHNLQNYDRTLGTIPALSPDKFLEKISKYMESCANFNPLDFLLAEYQPLPTILSAAKLLMEGNPLPQIKTAKSSQINETVEYIQGITNKTIDNNKNALLFLTGVPGSGKTLVGLQYTFNNIIENRQHAVMLSGNGPLVTVFNKIFNNKSIVQKVNNFIKEYYQFSDRTPHEDILIFDEAQRAWSAEQYKDLNSEPKRLLKIASRKKGCVFLCLMGEGQEIYKGEECGPEQWYEAVQQMNTLWDIYCPPHYASFFPAANTSKLLNLDTSLRSKSAKLLPKWVEAVLNHDATKAKSYLSQNNLIYDFTILITQNINNIQTYFSERYTNEEEKTYGFVTSSDGTTILRPPELNSYAIGDWFTATKESGLSCKSLTACATEFQCQGLELDTPVVYWRDDFLVKDGQWLVNSTRHDSDDENVRFNFRKNTYRVLLTRGREGLIIYIPPIKILDETFKFISECLKK